jgi:signal transduction histidine kinase
VRRFNLRPSRISDRLLLILLIAVMVIMLGGMLTTQYTANLLVHRELPVVHTLHEVRISLTRAHLWLEESITGDSPVSTEKTWADMDHADSLLTALERGGVMNEGLSLPKLPEKYLARVSRIRSSVKELRQMAEDRLAGGNARGPGSEADRVFDDTFYQLLQSIGDVEHQYYSRLLAEERLFSRINIGVLLLSFSVSVLVVGLAARSFKARASAIEQVESLNLDLETQVEQRTAQLNAINRELESFTYSVSHDLRTPLRGIDGFSQALLEDYAKQLDTTARGYLNRIRRATQRMGKLIDDLLSLSRINREEVLVEDLDMTSMANSIVRELREFEPDRNVAVNIQPGMKTKGDQRLIRLALSNLLGNAWKFTSLTEDAEITMTSTVEDGKAAFSIADNGAGFNMKYADKLFGAFQRLHSEEEFSGTGIGLATVHRVVARHGGSIKAEASLGAGATFCFTLEPNADLNCDQQQKGLPL